MQCIAVLLLEAAYQGRHTKRHNDLITRDIRKLMSWLRAMDNNDPVASRAHGVIRKILHNVAPVLASKATKLLKEDSADHSTDGPHSRGFAQPQKQQSGPGWAQGEFFDGTTPMTGQHYYPTQQTTSQQNSHASTSAPHHQSSYADVSAGQSMGQYHMPSTFGNPFLNSWDEWPPVVDMHNLWYPSNYDGSLPEDLSDMDLLGMCIDPQQSQGASLAYGQQQQ